MDRVYSTNADDKTNSQEHGTAIELGKQNDNKTKQKHCVKTWTCKIQNPGPIAGLGDPFSILAILLVDLGDPLADLGDPLVDLGEQLLDLGNSIVNLGFSMVGLGGQVLPQVSAVLPLLASNVALTYTRGCAHRLRSGLSAGAREGATRTAPGSRV